MIGYTVANSNEYLVITGVGIQEISIKKKAMILPGQKCTRISLSPLNYALSLHAMTVEKLDLIVPGNFTVGPKDDPKSLMIYARLLCDNQKGIKHIQDLVTGILEGEVRVLAATLTMEEIFKDRHYFKDHVLKGIQSELSPFGMHIYNANIKQLQDAPGSEYFKYLRLKSQEGAINQAKVDVAAAKTMGVLGEKKKESEMRMKSIQIETEAIIYEQERQIEIAKAKSSLSTEKVDFENAVQLARIEASKREALREAELQAQVEIKNAMVQIEKNRAEQLSKTTVEAEIIETLAKADLFKQKAQTDAQFYAKQKEAEAVEILFNSQAKGIKVIADAFGGDKGATLQYLMMEKGLFQDLAEANAKAVQGMAPKISVWNTGDGASTGDSGKAIRDIFQTLPPLLSTINEQTGIQPPAWIAQMPPSSASSTAVAAEKTL